jgi:hypothetical protein
MNPLTSQKFWFALVTAINAVVLAGTGIWFPSQLDNVSKMVAAVDGVIAVFITGYATPTIVAAIKTAWANRKVK